MKYEDIAQEIIDQVLYGSNYCRGCGNSGDCGKNFKICEKIIIKAAKELDEDKTDEETSRINNHISL